VHAENLLVDQSCHWQAVKNVTKHFPEPNGVSAFTFVIETVNSVDLSTFVISAEKEEIFWVFDLVAEE